ncbi:gliding motility-associated lipoprotein GldH [Flavobacterium haoranii]|uniref:Gliding motility-associated lipoprotein GldH n=2 Tax=Flavobacterium haoranii TaxID=683124 RepID=A0A1M6JR33_9FLAO|nr:gliding motility-associated lipoprotein GldH [Flavobacterium haoranii]
MFKLEISLKYFVQMKKFIIVLFLGLVSCNSSNTVDIFQKDFKENRWSKNDLKRLTFSIEETANYDIDLHLGHIYEYQFDVIPLQVTLFKDEQILFQETIDVKVKENGKDLGECVGDICDLYAVLKQDYNLDKGLYSLQIENKFDREYLPNVLGIGVRIKK